MKQNLVNFSIEPSSVEFIENSVQNEIASAIQSSLLQYKDKKKGLRILSKKMGIHEKTLNRILNFENKPGYHTVFKIFRVIHNEFNDSKLLELVPESVKKYLIKSNSQVLTADKNYSKTADQELQKNPVIAELFIIASTGPLHREDVVSRFGSYGLELIQKMIKSQLLQETHQDIYTLGLSQPVFDAETIISVGSAMISAHANPQSADEMKNNFISFFAEGLSEQAYQKWISIDQEAYRQKILLTRDQNNLGQVRAFTFAISEKIELNKLGIL